MSALFLIPIVNADTDLGVKSSDKLEVDDGHVADVVEVEDGEDDKLEVGRWL